jgi:hypothetical protein
MKNIFLVFFIAVFSLQYALGQRFKESTSNILTGSWSYKSGYYSYYNSSKKKLKESKVTDIQDLNVEVTSSDVKIIYPNRIYNTTYQLTVEKGKRYLTLDLGNGPVKYQILNNKSVTLQARHNITFYVDGDLNKKAAYTIFTVNMVKNQKKAAAVD